MATISTRTPIPPIKWVKLRQKSEAWLKSSTLGRIEAPVVVKPLTVSKTASVYDGISPLSTKGSAPISESETHESAVITKPSGAYITLLSGLLYITINEPIAKEIPIVMM